MAIFKIESVSVLEGGKKDKRLLPIDEIPV
jgi:hypothetical protein